MLYTIENNFLKVQINSFGAELQSICGKETGTEYLWQGDPAFWSGRAPNLFPICGRLVDGKYTYNGVTYEMDIHGFAKDTEWAIVNQTADSLTLQLHSTSETLTSYPWKFSLEMVYTLIDNSMSVTAILHNLDEKTQLFALGGHPGFNVPLTPGESFDEYFIQFDEPCLPKLLMLSDTCFYTGAVSPVPTDANNRLWLTHKMFEKDAWFFQDTAKGLTLCSEKGERSVHMSFPDMKYIGLWHRPFSEAPYVCIEPWTGVPGWDRPGVAAFENKPEMTALESQCTYRNTYTLTFK